LSCDALVNLSERGERVALALRGGGSSRWLRRNPSTPLCLSDKVNSAHGACFRHPTQRL
jgi:hypothetical protein